MYSAVGTVHILPATQHATFPSSTYLPTTALYGTATLPPAACCPPNPASLPPQPIAIE